jgi:hypothetical protein
MWLRQALPAEIGKKFGLRAISQVSPNPFLGGFKDIKELSRGKNPDLQIYIWAELGKSEGYEQKNLEIVFLREVLTPSPSFRSAEHRLT